ncbi:hypothetical protein Fleli_3715 [Bernardetia litoralis DSM 6794]|uniref:DUF302 domain-containing protein n=1 Tax=Bernardetia litoralis (strain ATCC 23117 / DSM 6794 / NBRC 15988 / NCIMB 1366 / Fx l1 / Sio-4) TaxID=880071 RepID=I4APZ2_BERLS|nr:DUF302 domain-containing protein [Bernardetia litoralis]AFM06027.1 hypothetical protein Fleli_3715 [Bernardetia litoralis DSM 6794]
MKTIFNYFIPLCASSVLLFSSCNDNQSKKTDSDISTSLENIDTTTINIDEVKTMTMPFVQKNHSKSVNEIYTSIKSAIEGNPNLKIIAEINHSENAKGIETEISESRLIIFGNPKVGTQLMQQNQAVAIDLPMKMLVYDDNGTTKVIYNNASILMNRYEIILPELEEKINGLLNKISQSEIEETQLQDLKLESILSDLQTKESSLSVDKTSENLEKLLTEKEFKLFAKIEHDKAAKNADLELRATRLFIFGKPQVGSQLMKLNSTIGLDLPMKILIWEDDNGKTQVSYFKGSFLANRHSIENEELINKIDGVLEMISNGILK